MADTPIDFNSLSNIIYRLIGGSAVPVGDSRLDEIKLQRQEVEQNLLDWLLTDIYECYKMKDVTWGSAVRAGNVARTYLTYLKQDINRMVEDTTMEETKNHGRLIDADLFMEHIASNINEDNPDIANQLKNIISMIDNEAMMFPVEN